MFNTQKDLLKAGEFEGTFMSYEYFSTPSAFVHLALIFSVLGFLFRDELYLRSLLLLGTIFYLLYYYFSQTAPLWDAIFSSSVVFAVNLIFIILILRERYLISMSHEETILYHSLGAFTPGQFRKIMKIAKWQIRKSPKVITHENKTCDRLFYVLDGEITIIKQGETFSRSGNMFIGEVGFMLGVPASATVTISPNTNYVEWKADELSQMFTKSQSIENAFKALFNFDMAKKVGASRG